MLTVEKITFFLQNKVLLEEGENIQFVLSVRRVQEKPPAKPGIMVGFDTVSDLEMVLHNDKTQTSVRYKFDGIDGLHKAIEAGLRKTGKLSLDELFELK